MNDKGFIQIPNWAARGVLHPREFAVYAALLSRRNSKTGECFPAYETIAGETGMSRRQVPLALAELVAEGFITVRRTRTRNTYTVLRFADERPAGYLSRFEQRRAERMSNSVTDRVQDTHAQSAESALRRVQDTHSNKNHKNKNHELERAGARRGATQRLGKEIVDPFSASPSEVPGLVRATEQPISPVREIAKRSKMLASHDQVSHLKDLSILSGQGEVTPAEIEAWSQLAPSQASESITEYWRHMGRESDYAGPYDERDPGYVQLSEWGKAWAAARMVPQEADE